MPAGRPTDYTPELADRICLLISTTTLGTTKVSEMCGITRESLFTWRLRHPEFADKYAQAKREQQELMAEEIAEIADESPVCVMQGDGWTKECVDAAGVQRNRLRVDTSKWLMSKLAPKVYGDRQAIEHSGEIKSVIVPDRIATAPTGEVKPEFDRSDEEVK